MNGDILGEIFLIAAGLSADAFAAAVSMGLNVKATRFSDALQIGMWFGAAQALMPAAGYFLGNAAHRMIERFDHWIAFILLFMIGADMIAETFKKKNIRSASFSFGNMFLLALATSVDALAAGIALALSDGTSLFISVIIIGTVTFFLSFCGYFIGRRFGERYKKAAGIGGGTLLILMGFKILFEHIGRFTI